MKPEEFNKLSLTEQEDFLNNGGSLEVPVTLEESIKKVENAVQANTCVETSEPQSSTTPLSFPEGRVSLSSNPLESKHVTYDGFLIQDPVELLFMLVPEIASGLVVLHPWQVQIMRDFANERFTDQDPFQAIVRACNGSGKDKYIIASCVVWLCMRYRRAIGVVTSSSGVQLDNQTCRYIKQLAEAANRRFGLELWQCNYRKYRCNFGDTGDFSEIFCYATDEPGKAEGYHPTDYGAKMGIFVSEDKSVSDDINMALNKCTGYTHRLHVSTPGLPMGHFYDYDSTAITREELESALEFPKNKWIRYHITAYDCSHISNDYIEQMAAELPGGRFGAAFRSQVEAEFGTTDEDTVIPYMHLYKCLKNPSLEHVPEPHNIGGLDLSRGGDETVLVVRNGNKIIRMIPFKFDNTEDTVEFLQEKFKDNGLTHPDSYIFTDAGGLGSPIIDRLKGLGWGNMRYVLNQGSAFNKRIYKNRGAEMWFTFAKFIEKAEILFDGGTKDDKRFIKQLSSRYYKRVSGEQHQLESKQEARRKNRPSPDRADATVLCFSNYKSQVVVDDSEKEKPFEIEKPKETVGAFDTRLWAEGKSGKWHTNDIKQDFGDVKDEIAEYNKRMLVNN